MNTTQTITNPAPMAATVEEAARDVAKCLNERNGQGLDLRHVSMLVHHAQMSTFTPGVKTPSEPSPTAPPASVVQQEPIGFISPKQVELIGDPECEFGKYIPMRKTPAGNFTLALYTHPAPETKPIDMVLHCPACGMQHIDKADPPVEFEPGAAQWNNPPHRSHLCHGCGHIWRPADVPTNGVQAVKTKGKADSPLVGLKAAVVQQEPVAWMADDGRVCHARTKTQAMHARTAESFKTPLYTHPAPQAKPAFTDPLACDSSATDEGCAALYRAHGIK